MIPTTPTRSSLAPGPRVDGLERLYDNCTYKEERAVGSVGIRDLARNASKVVDEVAKTGRPALVTKRGRVVAAVVPIDERELEDFVLANAPEYVRSRTEADEDLRRGVTRDAFDFLDDLHKGERVGGSRRARQKSSTRLSSSGKGRKGPRQNTRSARGRR
jgi:prevent-host-death family protein